MAVVQRSCFAKAGRVQGVPTPLASAWQRRTRGPDATSTDNEGSAATGGRRATDLVSHDERNPARASRRTDLALR